MYHILDSKTYLQLFSGTACLLFKNNIKFLKFTLTTNLVIQTQTF